MDTIGSVLNSEERAAFKLRQLYNQYGYCQYKMSKFEEYDLYVRNKDFLISDSVITFTDTNGKLLALKPDVTLSIIKNTKDTGDAVNKVYYNENVYRISKGTHSFKEIMQTGLECIGDVDTYCVYEVLMLACESLKSISEECVLDISHLGIVSDVIERVGIPEKHMHRVLKAIGDKNVHEIAAICKEDHICCEKAAILKKIVSTYGTASHVISILETCASEYIDADKMNTLKTIVSTLEDNGYSGMINIDFSVVNDMRYYNGIVFKGFINNVPSGVLSGGQYDKLLKKMGRKAKAIGFAVYLDMLERLETYERQYDVDSILLYSDHTDLSVLNKAIQALMRDGKTVMAQKSIPTDMKYKQLFKLTGNGVEIIENNA